MYIMVECNGTGIYENSRNCLQWPQRKLVFISYNIGSAAFSGLHSDCLIEVIWNGQSIFCFYLKYLYIYITLSETNTPS